MPDLLTHRDATPDTPRYVAPEVSYLLDYIVNVCFVGPAGAGDRGWVLVDAGLPGSADRIERAAARLFGPGARPAAIILTHGHFDHVGALQTLVHRWEVPVYAHDLELPYLTGRSSYPPPDPFVGGGAMSAMSFLYPKGPIDLGAAVRALPADGTVPAMPGWRWIPTPGHSPGHVSFVRDVDRTLIAGDAFTTTKQESAIAVFEQRRELHGPPMYFTPDWDAARTSLRHLADYAPTAAITGHGPPMRSAMLQSELRRLASHFDEWARPSHGRYHDRPAITDAGGVIQVPPPVVSGRALVLTGLAVGAAVGLAVAARRRQERTTGDGARALADRAAPERVQPISRTDELMLERSSELSALDGGYDITTTEAPTAAPSMIDLR
jgi:glyoxylase-like metal-dependent hydrolase (beta-lactamase superfamily II)